MHSSVTLGILCSPVLHLKESGSASSWWRVQLQESMKKFYNLEVRARRINTVVRVSMLRSFGITEFILSHFENRVLPKPVLGAWPVLHISLLVMNRLNLTESAIFIWMMKSLFPKDLINQNLFIRWPTMRGVRWTAKCTLNQWVDASFF